MVSVAKLRRDGQDALLSARPSESVSVFADTNRKELTPGTYQQDLDPNLQCAVEVERIRDEWLARLMTHPE